MGGELSQAYDLLGLGILTFVPASCTGKIYMVVETLYGLLMLLPQILKHERPARWRSFIPDLVEAAKISETICENCMAILKLLSEEIFDFSWGEMTQQKIKDLKQSLNSDFQLIHELCLYVLSASQRAELIRLFPQDPWTYSLEEIDEIRDLLIKYVLDHEPEEA